MPGRIEMLRKPNRVRDHADSNLRAVNSRGVGWRLISASPWHVRRYRLWRASDGVDEVVGEVERRDDQR